MDENEILMRIGKVVAQYHKQADEPTEELFNLWIKSLQEPMKSHFVKMGLAKCKGVLNFTRFQLELKDNGLEEYLKEKLSPVELQFWKSHG